MVSADKPKAKFVYYYCDESSHVLGHDFMAVGGIAVPDYGIASIKAELAAIKMRKGIPSESEIKWSKTSSFDCGETEYAKYLAELVKAGKVHFHIRFAPFRQYSHKLSGPLRHIDTTSKMHYQLLLYRALKFYGPRYKLRIYPDGGDCTHNLRQFLPVLLDEGTNRHGAKPNCIDALEQRDSNVEPLLQLLDVTLGAFTAVRNNRHLSSETKEPKRKLAEMVLALHGNPDVTANIPADPFGQFTVAMQAFSIWNVDKPKGPKKTPKLQGLNW